MVGKLHPRFFPNVFGPDADQPLDGAIVRQRFAALAAEVGARDRRRAHARGAGARLPRDRGRQHGQRDQEDLDPARPRHLGLRALLLRRRRRPARLPGRRCAGPEDGAGASARERAVGLRHGARRRARDAPAGDRGGARRCADADAPGAIGELAEEARAELRRQGLAPARITTEARIHIRYSGTDTPLEIPAGDAAELRRAFEAEHRARYGFVVEGRGLVVEQVTVEAIGHMAEIDEPERPVVARAAGEPLEPADRVLMVTARAPHQPPERFATPVFERADLRPGDRVDGPAIIVEATTTVVVEPGWQAELTARDHLVLEPRRAAARSDRDRHPRRPDHARGVQQPVHVDRRADGRDAAEHRLLGQHEGAPRLLLRAVRSARAC